MKDIVCFRCDRKGHIATNCTGKTKEDGSPCNERWSEGKKKRANVNMVDTTEDVPTTSREADRSEVVAKTSRVEDKPQPVVTVRQAGRSHLCVVAPPAAPMSLVVGGGNLLIQEILCNDVPLSAIIKTGVFVSVIDSRVVEANGWELGECNLINAAGDAMQCLGSLLCKVEVRIGRKSKVTTHRVVVVKDLCAQMLLGIELIQSLALVIDLSALNSLSFKRGTVLHGIVADHGGEHG